MVSKSDRVTITVGSNFEGKLIQVITSISRLKKTGNKVGDGLVKEICILTLLFSKDNLKSRIVK